MVTNSAVIIFIPPTNTIIIIIINIFISNNAIQLKISGNFSEILITSKSDGVFKYKSFEVLDIASKSLINISKFPI